MNTYTIPFYFFLLPKNEMETFMGSRHKKPFYHNFVKPTFPLSFPPVSIQKPSSENSLEPKIFDIALSPTYCSFISATIYQKYRGKRACSNVGRGWNICLSVLLIKEWPLSIPCFFYHAKSFIPSPLLSPSLVMFAWEEEGVPICLVPPLPFS